MWQQFVDLFSGYGIIPMIILFVGLFMCMIELIIPGFGVFGVLGGIAVVGGVIARVAIGIKLLQFCWLVVLIVVVIIISILLVGLFAKMGLLGKISLVQSKTVVPHDYEKPTKQQKKLIGKVGFAQTVFKASGKLVIDGTVYDAMSEGEFIEKDSKVKVIAIKNNNIIVKKI